MRMTSTVEVIIQAVSPLSGTGVSWAKPRAGASMAPSASAAAHGRLGAAVKVFTGVLLSMSLCSRSWGGDPERDLDGVGACLARADAHGLGELGHENLAVADLSGAGDVGDGFDHLLDDGVVDGNLDLGLGQEVDAVFRAAVELGVPALPAKALHLGHRDALHADVGDGLAHFIELERLDDGGDELHRVSLGDGGR